jgi:hypothetical protein
VAELWHRDAGSVKKEFVPVRVVGGSFDKAFEGLYKTVKW